MAVTLKALAEALAELFGVDEAEALSLLLQKEITNWGEFQQYINDVQRQDRSWKA